MFVCYDIPYIENSYTKHTHALMHIASELYIRHEVNIVGRVQGTLNSMYTKVLIDPWNSQSGKTMSHCGLVSLKQGRRHQFQNRGFLEVRNQLH